MKCGTKLETQRKRCDMRGSRKRVKRCESEREQEGERVERHQRIERDEMSELSASGPASVHVCPNISQ